jgi:hypothetical protein
MRFADAKVALYSEKQKGFPFKIEFMVIFSRSAFVLDFKITIFVPHHPHPQGSWEIKITSNR